MNFKDKVIFQYPLTFYSYLVLITQPIFYLPIKGVYI